MAIAADHPRRDVDDEGGDGRDGRVDFVRSAAAAEIAGLERRERLELVVASVYVRVAQYVECEGDVLARNLQAYSSVRVRIDFIGQKSIDSGGFECRACDGGGSDTGESINSHKVH